MEHDGEHRAKRPNDAGPTGRRVAKNIEMLREDRGLTQAQLAERVESLGRPMSRQAVSKVEQGFRRVDVDDLVAISIALDTTPSRVLLPGVAGQDEVELLPAVSVPSLDAWRWANGEEPLPPHLAPPGRQALDASNSLATGGARINAFLRENRPHATPDGYFGRMFVHGDLTEAVVNVARLAREHGIPLAEVKHFVDFVYTTTLADEPGREEG